MVDENLNVIVKEETRELLGAACELDRNEENVLKKHFKKMSCACVFIC